MAYLKLKVHYLSYYLIETDASLSIKLYMTNYKDFTDRNSKIEGCIEVKYTSTPEGHVRIERFTFDHKGNTITREILRDQVTPQKVMEEILKYEGKMTLVIGLKEKIKDMKEQRKRSGIILSDQDKFIYKRAMKELEKRLRVEKEELRGYIRGEFC